MNFLGLSFLSPLFLVGVAAAAIPLVIHLSRSRRTKKMKFSTTRFFTDQFLRSYRMSRLKELLLLACRMMLFGLLALALSRPLFMPKNSPAVTSGSRCVVFVVDSSASMSHRSGDGRLIDRAKQAVRDVLDGLRPGDSAAVVLAGRRDAGPEVFEPVTEQLNDVRASLDKIKPATLGTDLSGAVRRAEVLAKGSAATSKEVYVLSDLQDSGWEVDDRSADQGRSDVSFTFVRVRPDAPENLAVTAVQYSAARPMIGVPFEIKPFIAFQGQRSDADVRLVIDGQKVAERKIERPSGTMFATPRFHHAFMTPGWHHGYVEVLDESMPLDNRRYFAFEIVESVKILAVNGAASQVPHLDELVYLRAALGVTTDDDAKSPIAIDVVSPAELGAKTFAELSAYPLIVLANVESLPPAVVERLETYVDSGKRLLVTLGDKVSRAAYNETLANTSHLHGGLFPGPLRKLEGDPAGSDAFASVADVDYDHVALAAFQDPQFANLNTVRFKALWDVDPGDSNVLMRATNGVPVLMEKAFGRGLVLVFASTADRDWTNFPVRSAFLPWTHRLVGYLAQDAVARENFFSTGSPIAVPASSINGTDPVVVKLPEASGVPGETRAYPSPSADDPNVLVFGDTEQSGVYTFTRETGKDADRPALVAVNLESYESELAYLDDVFAGREGGTEAGFQSLLPGTPKELVRYVADPAGVSEASLTTQRGSKLWNALLVVVLLLALFEPWLANVISARHYGKPKEIADAKPGTARPNTRPLEVTAS